MRILACLSLAGISCVVASGEQSVDTDERESLPIEDYRYGDHLDINKVIEISEPPEDCKPELERMTYEDSNGKRHVVEFPVMAKCPGISTDN
ncbi:DUF2790 domain-containing protein [Azotobacter beijerinckii]|uniref:DUF2790 domain-containing protein n=1 Tax=Azotobacter beijerinckii TaxID=170623 RepID=UPI0037BF572E